MSEDADQPPRFQFRLKTILGLMVCLGVYLAFDRAVDGTSLDGLAQWLGVVYAVMIGVCLLGSSTRFA